MPRRPGGGTPPPASVEAGIRDLALNTGPDVGKLTRGGTEGIATLMALARPPQDCSGQAKASAVLRLLHSLLPEIGNPRWRAAAEAALRVPPDQYASPGHDSLAGRLRAAAERNDGGNAGIQLRSEEDYRGYWISAASRLAVMLGDKIRHLNDDVESWRPFVSAQEGGLSVIDGHELEKVDILFTFRGDRGHETIYYRWFVPEVETSHFDALGWYFSDPDARVEITPIANCKAAEDHHPAPTGGRRRRLYFARTVMPGETYFFAYLIRYHSGRPCRPAIQQDVLRPTAKVTFRIQFDPELVPSTCWSFGGRPDADSWQPPSECSSQLLPVTSVGYVEHTFVGCDVGCKYGVRWLWPSNGDDWMPRRG